MITLFGSAVPSMTTVLPFGGGDLSGVVFVIFVGAAWYFASSALAFATPGSDDELELELDDEPEEPEPLSAPDASDPQAVSAAVAATTPRIAGSRLSRLRILWFIPLPPIGGQLSRAARSASRRGPSRP